MTKTVRTLFWALLGLLWPGHPAHAAAVITITEAGSDILVTGSGTLDISGLSFDHSGPVFSLLDATSGSALLGGTGSSSLAADLYEGASGPGNWGSGPFRLAGSGSGVIMGVVASSAGAPVLYVPAGYVSGGSLTSTSTILGETYGSMGLTFGVYVYSWSADTLTVIVGLPAAPALTATAGDGQVHLNWTTPAANGPAITGYEVRYRPVGGSWTTWPFSGAGTSTDVSGLVNGTSYEFAVAAINARGTGAVASATAMPYVPPTLSYPSPVTASAGTPVTITPTTTSVLGTPSFTLTGGALPSGLSLDAGTGVITGTSTAVGSYTVTVRLAETGAAGTASSTFTLNVIPAAATAIPTLSAWSLVLLAGLTAALGICGKRRSDASAQ